MIEDRKELEKDPFKNLIFKYIHRIVQDLAILKVSSKNLKERKRLRSSLSFFVYKSLSGPCAKKVGFMYLNARNKEILEEALHHYTHGTTYLETLQKLIDLSENIGAYATEEEACIAFQKLANEKIQQAKNLCSRPFVTQTGWKNPEEEEFKDLSNFKEIFIRPYLLTNPLPFDFDFVKRLTAIAFLKKAGLKKSVNCFFVCTATCLIDEKPYVFLAETLLKGFEFSDYLKQDLPLEKIKMAIEKLALSLAELHSLREGTNCTWNEKMQAFEKEEIDSIVHYCREKIPQLENERIEKKLLNLLERAKKTSYQMGFCHGDLTMHNIIYNDKAKKIGLIDTSTLMNSVSTEFNPIGYPLHDYFMSIYGIKSCLYKYPHHQNTDELVQHFERTYKNACGIHHPKEHLEYNYLIHNLFKLRQHIFTEQSLERKSENLRISEFMIQFAHAFL